MALIVAARFDTFDAAQTAAFSLMEAGVASDNLHTFFVNPPGSHDRYPLGGDRVADPGSRGAPQGTLVGIAIFGIAGAVLGGIVAAVSGIGPVAIAAGAGVGAYIGSLLGAMNRLGKSHPAQTGARAQAARGSEGRQSGVVLAAHVEPEQEKRIAGLLRDAGGVEVERARGRWHDGKWEDFDPLSSPDLERNI